MTPLSPVTLSGRHPAGSGQAVRLEPLTRAHAHALWRVACDPALWTWSPNPVTSPDDLDRYIGTALAAQAAGTALPFAIVADGVVAGSTRFGNIDLANRRLEIGWTWLGERWQRTAVNTEAKLLLMWHAFDVLGVRRVEWKTDARNAVSRAAIARLGATEEGTLRQHTRLHDGTSRDTVYFSVVADEWPAVEARLEERLGRGAAM